MMPPVRPPLRTSAARLAPSVRPALAPEARATQRGERAQSGFDPCEGRHPMQLVRPLGILLAIGLTTTLAHATYYGQQKSLYQRLGGKPAITAVDNDFVGNVAKDGRINRFFAASMR